MHPRVRKHLLTTAFSAVLALSVFLMLLGFAGVVATSGVWRVLIIPAYLVMLGSAILATALSVPNNPLFWVICTAVLLLPFVAIDFIRERRRR